MGRRKDLEAARRGPANVRFSDLCRIIEAAGYVLDRQKGSQRIYVHPTRPELPLINLQSSDHQAKPYQVRQVIKVIDDFGLEVQ